MRPSDQKTAILPLARTLFEASGVSERVAASTVDRLLEVADLRTYARGQVICLLGEVVTHLHVFLEGTVEVSTEDADGDRAVCWYMGPGHWLGLISVLDGKPSPHNYLAHTDTSALLIPRPLFLDAMADDPKLARLCISILCKRARRLFGQQAADILLPLRARIARLLLMLHAQWGNAGPDDRDLGLKFSQDDFAAMLGVSRQSLNRELRALEAEGRISLAYARIRLLDIPALKAAASKTAP